MTAPPISKDLIEYLEKVFAPAHLMCAANTPPHEIAALVHREQGVQSIIRHIRATYEEQQNEDPLNVHEST
jgi:hypothetical protein